MLDIFSGAILSQSSLRKLARVYCVIKKPYSGRKKHESVWHEAVICENEAGLRN